MKKNLKQTADKNFKATELATPVTNTQKMADIAYDMAEYFDACIKTANLARWVSIANECCSEFRATVNPGNDVKYAIDFINEIGRDILPVLITCKNDEEKIEFLKVQIPFLFENNLYGGTKEILGDIGFNYMKTFVKYNHYEGRGVAVFMKTYSCFLGLIELFADYEELTKEELDREFKKVA